MWKDEQSAALADELEAVIALLPPATGLRELVREPLRSDGRGLSGGTVSLWSLLPLVVCESICGQYERALPAAAAREFLVAAAEVFDDIEDADSPGSLADKCGQAVATNVATTLVILAEKAMTRLESRGVPDRVIVRVMDELNSAYLKACAGQHLDLSLEPGTEMSEDVCLKVAELKSASQVECACRIGALLADANEQLVGSLATFGYNLGMASQIANDIKGISQGADIRKPKISLPTYYAAAHGGQVPRADAIKTFGSSEATINTQDGADNMFRGGAVYFAALKMEVFRQRAFEVLRDAQKGGANVERLTPILD